MPYNPESQTIAIFGAGTGAQLWLERNARQDEMYVLVDNNARLHGTTFLSRPVLNPLELRQLDISQVLILVSDIASIIPQLMELGFPETAIVVPPKATFSPQPFLEPEARAHGLLCVREMVHLASLSGFEPVVEMGAALGIYRDGDLIHWDNGAEISVPPSQGEGFEKLSNQISLSPLFHNVAAGQSANGPHLVFRSRETNIILSIYTRTRKMNGMLGIAEGTEFLSVEPEILWPPRMHVAGGFSYPLPSKTEKYLERLYGADWATPRPDFSYASYAQHGELLNRRP